MVPGVLKNTFEKVSDLYDRFNLSLVRLLIDPDYIAVSIPAIHKIGMSAQNASTEFLSKKSASGDLAPRPVMKMFPMLAQEAQAIARPALPLLKKSFQSPHFLAGTVVALAAYAFLNSSAAAAIGDQLNQAFALANNEPKLFETAEDRPPPPKKIVQPISPHPAMYI